MNADQGVTPHSGHLAAHTYYVDRKCVCMCEKGPKTDPLRVPDPLKPSVCESRGSGGFVPVFAPVPLALSTYGRQVEVPCLLPRCRSPRHYGGRAFAGSPSGRDGAGHGYRVGWALEILLRDLEASADGRRR